MGVDLRLLALWMKAAPDEMYVLSRREVEDLGVVNDGRRRPEWKVSTFPGGTALEGRQATIDGTGSVSFSCDHKQIIFGSVYDGPGQDGLVTAQKWSHVLTIDGQQQYPLQAVSLSHRDRVVRSTFVLPTVAVRRLMSARRVGHVMNTASGPAFSLGYSIDIDAKSASAVRTFLGKCLRSVARAAR